MKSIIVYLSLILLVACIKSTVPDTTPSCIKQAIKDGQLNGFAIGKILSYTFQNDTVYLLEPATPMPSATTPVYDKKCNLICSVGGLISPNLILCNGDIFSAKAVFIKTVWTK